MSDEVIPEEMPDGVRAEFKDGAIIVTGSMRMFIDTHLPHICRNESFADKERHLQYFVLRSCKKPGLDLATVRLDMEKREWEVVVHDTRHSKEECLLCLGMMLHDDLMDEETRSFPAESLVEALLAGTRG